MILTTAQKTTLKTDIAANTAEVSLDYGDGNGLITNQIKNWDPANDGLIANVIANWYNFFPGTNFFINYKTVPITDVRGAVTWKKLSSIDIPAVASVPSVPTAGETYLLALWQARSLAIQERQFNLQMLLTAASQVNGTQVIDASQKAVWQGLQDALTDVLSGASGAAQDAGWTAVKKVLCRKATNLEKLFADTQSGAASFTGADNTHAALSGAEGLIDGPTLADAVRTG